MYQTAALGIEEAQGALNAMIEECKKEQYWPYGCFAIVDSYGELVAFARMDGAVKQGVTMAIRKAYTSAIWGRSTRAFGQMIAAKTWRLGPGNYGPEYTTIWGGVAIIRPEGKKLRYATPFCIGAIGVATTGPGELDEFVGQVGLQYIEKKLWPESAGVVPLIESAHDKPEH